MATRYVYVAVTPDIIGNDWDLVDRSGSKFCFIKFGVTDNPNLDVLRAGYTTHNPSIGFNKMSYETNISRVVTTTDLGKAIEQNSLNGSKLVKVGTTEWYSSPHESAIKLFESFSRQEATGNLLDYQSVTNFLARLNSVIKRA
ncbi:hypothetical protein [Mangrovitalea sediminis]|uniref:hypothetical protein n=1 Tax=Mangrovitalea sediminis TaxID=1982043 RepID=UPI000BE60456|nr:hypothetical protein [Mangrovitalea sediminis]